jgi:Na+/pantothenate symporter
MAQVLIRLTAIAMAVMSVVKNQLELLTLAFVMGLYANDMEKSDHGRRGSVQADQPDQRRATG